MSEQTDASGLIYMQARFYLPMFGRFASPDPARDQHFEETQSWNIYSYVQNSPVIHVDPDGEAAQLIVMPLLKNAAFGAALEIACQALERKIEGRPVFSKEAFSGKNLAKIGIAASVGVLTSGVEKIPRMAKAAVIVGKVALGVAGEVSKNKVDSKGTNVAAEAAVSVVTNSASTVVAEAVSNAVLGSAKGKLASPFVHGAERKAAKAMVKEGGKAAGDAAAKALEATKSAAETASKKEK